MSSKKIMSASQIRAEMARHLISRRTISKELGISYDYTRKILLGKRDAQARRAEMAQYISDYISTKEKEDE